MGKLDLYLVTLVYTLQHACTYVYNLTLFMLETEKRINKDVCLLKNQAVASHESFVLDQIEGAIEVGVYEIE